MVMVASPSLECVMMYCRQWCIRDEYVEYTLYRVLCTEDIILLIALALASDVAGVVSHQYTYSTVLYLDAVVEFTQMQQFFKKFR